MGGPQTVGPGAPRDRAASGRRKIYFLTNIDALRRLEFGRAFPA